MRNNEFGSTQGPTPIISVRCVWETRTNHLIEHAQNTYLDNILLYSLYVAYVVNVLAICFWMPHCLSSFHRESAIAFLQFFKPCWCLVVTYLGSVLPDQLSHCQHHLPLLSPSPFVVATLPFRHYLTSRFLAVHLFLCSAAPSVLT